MRIVLLAVGLGSFFIIGVRSLQENLIDAVRGATSTPDSPDMFLLDIQRDQVEGGARRRSPRIIDPGAAAPRAGAGVARARRRRRGPRSSISRTTKTCAAAARSAANTPITYRATLESNERIVAGHDVGCRRRRQRPKCRSSSSSASRSRSTSATRSASTCSAASIAAKVTSVRLVEWSDSRAGGFMFVFRPGRAREGAAQLHRLPARAAGRSTARARLQTALVGGGAERVGDRRPRDHRRHQVGGRQRHAGRDGGRHAGRVQRPDDPDRRGGDDEVPPRLRGRDLQDARRDAAADRDGAACSSTACSACSPAASAPAARSR